MGFESWMADRGADLMRPGRKDEPPSFGSLGRIRQWIEPVFATCEASSGSSATASDAAGALRPWLGRCRGAR